MTAHGIRLFAMLLGVAVSSPSFAHTGSIAGGIVGGLATGFSGGLLHPLLVPAHVLTITGLGILIARQRRWGRAASIGFIAALAVGLAAIALAALPRFAAETVLTGAAVAGVLVAWARPLPEPAGCALAAACGLAIGLDSPPHVISIREANLMLFGTGVGAAVLLLVVVACASRLRRSWQRIGARVIGSWIAASAILVLALQLR